MDLKQLINYLQSKRDFSNSKSDKWITLYNKELTEGIN